MLRNFITAGLLLGALPVCAQDTTSNLVVHWKMDESSGTTAYDSSGNGYNGTVYGTASWQSGYIDNALYLDGSSYSRITGLAAWSNITLAAWANLSTADSGGAELFSIGDYVIVRLDASGKCEAIIYNGSGWDSVSVSQTYAGTGWHHFALVFSDSSNYLRLYIDGTLAASATNYNSISYSGLGSNSYVGRHGNGGTSTDFTGKVDDVRFYSRALTSTDISALGSSGDSLMAHWKLDEASGTNLFDASGNGHHAAFNTGSPSWISGQRESALEFDGTQDADTNASFDPPATGTLAFWFRFDAAPTGSQRLLGNGGDWEVRTDSTGTIYCDVGGSFSTGFVTAAGVAEAGVWHHLAAVYNSSADTYLLYLDGDLVASGTLAITDQPAAVLSFGTRTGSTERFAGTLDDIRVYNAELSHAEVVELYGLVGHWKFDEATGTTVADESPNHNDVAFNTGTPSWTDGVRGAGLDFGGTTDADTNGSFDPPATGTIAFWFRFNDLPTGTERLFGTGGDWEVRSNATGALYADIGGGTAFAPSDVASDGHWHHFVFRYNDENNAYELFLDGETVASGTMTIERQSSATLTFGTRTGIANYFDGALDDFRVYGYELTDAQIAELYGLVGRWKLDETSGSIASDSSLLDNNGYHWNGATPNSTGPYTGHGAVAAEFYGDDEHVGIYSVDAYQNITEYISVAAWVYFDQAVSDQTAQQIVIGRDDWSSQTGFILLADQPYNNSLVFRVYNGSTHADATWSNPDIGAGEWHHVVGLYDGTSVKLYVDGELKDSNSFSSPLVPRSSGNLNLGYALDGRLHDVRLYNRAVSEAEVAEMYGLVGHWKFDETAGSTAGDSSLMEQDATYMGTATLATDSASTSLGTAVELDGATAYVDTGGTLANDLEAFTIAGWVRPDNVDAFTTLFGQYGVLEFGMYDTANRIRLWTGNGYAFDYDSALTIGEWTHIAATGDGAQIKFYVDGAEVTSVTQSATTYGNSTYKFLIGAGAWSGSGDYFDGRMDDIRLYNRAINPAEALQLYESGLPQGIRIIRWVEVQ